MKAVVAAFNQEKALVGAFSVITNLRMDFFEALVKACLSHELLLPTTIMTQFGAFVPGLKGDNTPTLMTDGCGNLHCQQNCFHSADLR